jgi:hypothetical protein
MRLVGFITKKSVTMYRHTIVKILYLFTVQLLEHTR